MRIFWKLYSLIRYFYSREKRLHCKAKHIKPMIVWNDRLRKKGVIGKHTYIVYGSSIAHHDTRIGSFCSIAKNVSIGTTSHPIDRLTTHPFTYRKFHGTDWPRLSPEQQKAFPQKPVFIGNDVWIGLNVVIMDGVTIGNGAVIGAGAVVTKDIPPYAVAVGVPAKVLKYRFDEETIARLEQSHWWDYPDEFISKLPFDDVKKCLEILEETAKKQ